MISKLLFEALKQAAWKSNLRNQQGQLDAFAKRDKAGPNIPPLYKHQEAERTIHSVPDKFKGTDIIKEAGYKGPSLGEVKRSSYEDTTDHQLDLFKKKRLKEQKLLKSFLNKDRSK